MDSREIDEAECRITFALNLRLLRTVRGKSQRDLAREIGKDNTFISHLEGGRRGASFGTIIALANALNVRPGVFFEDMKLFEIEKEEPTP